MGDHSYGSIPLTVFCEECGSNVREDKMLLKNGLVSEKNDLFSTTF